MPELPVPIPSLPEARWRPLTLDVAENPTGALGAYEQVGFRPIRRSIRLQRPFVRGVRAG